MDGVEIVAVVYEEPGLRLEDIVFTASWDELLGMGSGLSGSVLVSSLELSPAARDSGGDNGPLTLASFMGRLAESLYDPRVRSLRLQIADLAIESGGRVLSGAPDLSWIESQRGETHLAVELKGDGYVLDTRAKLSADGQALGIDFVGSGSSWELFHRDYLSSALEPVMPSGTDVYVGSIREDVGWIDHSGYLRWDSQRSDHCAFALLVDLGPIEFYAPEGELYLESASMGFATDGADRMSAFGGGGVDSIRMSTWSESGGVWGFKIAEGSAAVEIKLAESGVISFRHTNWKDLLNGDGTGRFHLELREFGLELLHWLELKGVPADLSALVDATLEGGYSLRLGRLSLESATLDAKISELDWPEGSLAMKDSAVRAEIAHANEGWSVDAFELSSALTETFGVKWSDLALEARGRAGEDFMVEPITTKVLGARVRVGGFRVNPKSAGVVPIRVDVEGIEMAQLAEAIPQFKGEAAGKLSGYLACEWEEGRLGLVDGRLRIDEESDARLSYNVDGLLTGGMQPGTAAYEQYRRAERAFEDLSLSRFQIDVFPDDDATRPLRVVLYGESIQDGITVPVDYTLNVNADDTSGLFELLSMIRRGELELSQ